MNGKKVEYPAKLVGYRIDAVHDCIVLFDEIPVLFNDAELERRLRTYRALEEAGGMTYTFELVSLGDLDARMAAIRADLERQQQQVKDWWRGREKREPEPVPDYWAEAVFDAAQLALAHFMEQGNKAALKRLPRAQAIAEGQNWHRVGDRLDTWLMPGSSRTVMVCQVNGLYGPSLLIRSRKKYRSPASVNGYAAPMANRSTVATKSSSGLRRRTPLPPRR